MTKSRNKPTRSCLMCQRRKKKCDRKTPCCSACDRKGYECVYNVKLESQLVDGTKQLSKAQLIAKIGILKSQLRDKSEASTGNPLNKLWYTSSKYGRVLTYGPTSVRCLIKSSQMGWYYSEIWKTIKEKRNEWKKKHVHAIKMEEVYSVGNPLLLRSGNSVLDALCCCLPSNEIIKTCLSSFFNSSIFKEFEIVDPKKVFSDVDLCLIFLEGEVKSIELGNKKNYYRVGIITKILSMTYFRDKNPPAIDVFHKYLASFESTKSAHLERIQFFMLKYIHINAKGFTGGDGGNSLAVVSLAFSTALQIGLYRKETSKLFRDEDRYISNLWQLIVQSDLECSFSIGSALLISSDCLSEFDQNRSVLVETEQNYSPATYLMFLRKIIAEIYSTKTAPDLNVSILQLKFSILTNFGSLTPYLSQGVDSKPINFHKLLTILLSLQMISNLSIIESQINPNSSRQLIQHASLCHIASLVLVLNYIRASYNRQTSLKGADNVDAFSDIGLGLYLHHTVLPRVTHELVLIFSDAYMNREADGSTLPASSVDLQKFINTFDTYLQTDTDVSFNAVLAYRYFKYFHDTFKNERGPELDKLLNQSYLFIISDEFSTSIIQAFDWSLPPKNQEPQIVDMNALPYGIKDNDLFLDSALDMFDDEFSTFFA
ncbi:unnamed protein product [Kluyveromyces dobzhanskii CBS 2104]|uniref:WGS project CCBQ000000000 data, contig 00102 n=1 Tax=Kluyveromyces dobzhanskii CBS 2104 TaxID=1427455 RepID=A0A0A8L6I1_9SACH|nr:unnamed protein product [Kluyveromyces dobzhanskii CBS 2104]